MNTGQWGKGSNCVASDATGSIARSCNDPEACRYRCAHVAWIDCGRASGSDRFPAVVAMDRQVKRASSLLQLLDQVCRRMADLCARPINRDVGVATTSDEPCWVLQVHSEMLVAVNAMQSLRLHSAKQLLAHPRNHVARSCLEVSRALLSALTNSLTCGGVSVSACRNLHAVDLALEMMRAEQRHWLLCWRQEVEQERDPFAWSITVTGVDVEVTHGADFVDQQPQYRPSRAEDKCPDPRSTSARPSI